MLKVGNTVQLSASDLVGHLNCRNLTELDLAVAKGALAKPRVWNPLLDVARERGLRHEQGYVDHLRAKGFEVETLAGMEFNQDAVAATAKAMSLGREVIVQGAFLADNWGGRPDVLLRVETPSSLGDWSYEVVDTKLSRETKGGTVLQLSLYSDLLAKAQGLTPQWFHVIAPWSEYQPQTFRVADFAAYYRRVRASLEQAVKLDQTIDVYPDPKPFCDVCRWQERCDAKRHADDHLSLVAGISKIQIAELAEHAVTTCAALAAMPIPLTFKPGRGSASALERVREQARIQVEGRAAGVVLYERLEAIPGFGLAKLCEPSPGDIFLDFEGDPFVGEGGLEYLFGYSFRGEDGQERYVADWAFSRAEERAAFERFIDFVMNRLSLHPDLHIYHFAPYEPAALKRLMGRYATREDELDQLLRGKRFVDLFAVVRQGLRASVESYSIKRLEPLYGYVREASLPDANQALAQVQALLELGDASDIGDDERRVVEAYNRDDCKSTWRLRDWLETVRASAISDGEIIERPALSDAEPSQALSERQLKIAALVERLTFGVPDDPLERTAEQQARWILPIVSTGTAAKRRCPGGNIFGSATFLPKTCLMNVRVWAASSSWRQLAARQNVRCTAINFRHRRLSFAAAKMYARRAAPSSAMSRTYQFADGWVDIKKRCDSAGLHPEALFAHNDVNTTVLADALLRIGEYVADHGLEGDGPYQAARDLLMRREPRVHGQPLRVEGETALAAALRLALALDGGVMPIQGPPGSGKTYTGARMITEMVNAGLRVGVTANSHKVIRNLLDEVGRAADEIGIDLTCIQKVPEEAIDEPRLQFTTDNATCLSALHDDCRVAGGTAWFWTRPDAVDAVDVLFVDEAAQMSLANVLAVSQAAKTVVLLGDPQQLDQPTQGTHPDGVDTSALDHMLAGHQTIPEDRGLFLEETWRLHPTICAFTSELFYEGRLHPRPGLELQEIRSTSVLHGAGLRYLPVAHTGNQSSSPRRQKSFAVWSATSSPRTPPGSIERDLNRL